MLQVTQKHIIGEIDLDSPAHRCGMHAGDALLCIDETCVMKTSHRDCVEMIK